MDELLGDRTAVVTGGASGNGRAIAELFAQHGADIVVADLQRAPREGGTPTAEAVENSTEASATFVECDVSDTDDLETAIDAAVAFGGVDIMVNNAGIFQNEDFLKVDESSYDAMMDVNVKGVFFGSQLAAQAMQDDGEGVIINMSSVAGLCGNGKHVPYSTSKGAVRLMTYAMAGRLGKEGIRVNAIHPGVVDTEMAKTDLGLVGSEHETEFRESIPLERLGVPADVAGVALCLASEYMGYVSGASITVDGGKYQFG